MRDHRSSHAVSRVGNLEFTNWEREEKIRDIKKNFERKRKLKSIGMWMYDVADKDVG